MTLLAFFVTLFVGVILGFGISAILVVGGRCDDNMDKFTGEV
jgi:hypothetical protein